ncbi:MFS transporter [Wenxinia saemankumensis]|uniref:Predicted arabinose efflux permease, MFS family n=1 Tax=Wenxinia saemankumensis TaxID=1447782 RepID=A0A1M6EPL6_9RHOB|nr:MFS transporter [Wenxinia saemankumensis]SHI87412.1 Predicted arabinose efflux permease, MFS family [Wenxinia saemankumensis]
MTYLRSLSAAGFMATAVGFGPARMGFGLFVPEFRSAFSMSAPLVGIVSSIGFAGYFVGLLMAQFLLDRRGPAAPVLTGLIAATAGLGIVAVAPGVPVLAAGVFIAGSSAGLGWTPFNDAVHRKVRDADRPGALSEISTGTTMGIAGAGAVALAAALAGFGWRVCWAIFAGAGAAAFVGNWLALRRIDKAAEGGSGRNWRHLLARAAAPLFAVAFVFGVTSAVYISFSADHFARQGLPGMPAGSTAAFVFIVYGLCGLAGLVTGRVRDAIGLTPLLRALLCSAGASLALAAQLAGSWGGLLLSAGLQGVNVMMMSAVLAFWSERLFPSFASLGFTLTVLCMAAGSVIGPALAGAISAAIGPGAMFYAAAALPLVAAALIRGEWVSERPAEIPEP